MLFPGGGLDKRVCSAVRLGFDPYCKIPDIGKFTSVFFALRKLDDEEPVAIGCGIYTTYLLHFHFQ